MRSKRIFTIERGGVNGLSIGAVFWDFEMKVVFYRVEIGYRGDEYCDYD